MRVNSSSLPRTSLEELLDTNRVLVADGAMGTSLFEQGLSNGELPELWNVTHPERIASVHQGFVEAGADIILTNTFGGSRTRLSLHGLENRCAELNVAAVDIGRAVAENAARPVLVAGSVGPTGELFEPVGPLTFDEGVDIFSEQMEALVAGGCDTLWVETMSSREELAAAVAAADQTDHPVVTTMSFDTNGHTMMGVRPTQLAEWWQQAGRRPAAMGANCGVGPGDVVLAAAEIKAAHPSAVVVAKANCGIPRFFGTELRYPAEPGDMPDYAELALDAGARIVGACCGSTPEHIRLIRKTVDSHQPGEAPTRSAVEARLGLTSKPPDPSGLRPRRRRRASQA